MGLAHSPTTVMDGLVLYLDAANPKSYTNYNLATYSQDFENAVYSKSLTITSTGLLAPDGTLTASTLTDNSNTVWQAFSRSFTVNNDSASYNISIYIKKTTGGTSTRTGFNVSFTGGTAKSYNIRFNADTGVATGGDSNLVTTENNDYWRLSFAVSNNSTGNTTFNLAYYPATGFYNGADDATATGSHTVWGLQVTRGAALLPYKANSNDSVTAWLDLGGSGSNGTLTNGPAFSNANNGIISFDGVDDYADVSPNTVGNFGTSDFTVSCWGRAADGSTGTRGIFTKYNPHSGNGTGWFVFFRDGNVWLRITQDLVAPLEASSISVTVPTGQWYNITMRRSSYNFSLYINGSLNTSNTTTNIIDCSSTAPLRIGSGYSSGYYYSGSVGSCSIYNRALTAVEIQQNFNALRGRYGV